MCSSESLYKSLVGCVEEEVCIRLSVLGYGKKEEMLSSLSGVCRSEKVSELGVSEEKRSSLVLPWCGKVDESVCLNLRKDLGLYTQCKKSRLEGSSYCVCCEKLIAKNGGESQYGTVSDRMKCGIMEYKDPRGNSPIVFTKIMKKLNQSREEVELEGKRLGICIPECHFEEKKERRGRPKKDTSAEDTDSEKNVEPQEKKKRGRPKKEKEIISNTAGEDLIASLVQESVTVSTPQEEKLEEKELEEEDDETVVIKFEFNGTTYLKSEDHILYDVNSHEGIGIWNDETKEIENLPEDED
tara:strand:+ start:53 stop:946 length:894 start_codon:yes stop_codon:yes gene_type:complete